MTGDIASKIEDYALLGDCETAALVLRGSSIDWLCWPRCDSGACCGAFLGGCEQGYWSLRPTDSSARGKRHYCKDTLVLEMEFATAQGVVTRLAFMRLRDQGSHLIRLVVCGQVALRTELILRFDCSWTAG